MVFIDLEKDNENSIYKKLSEITKLQPEWANLIYDVGTLMTYPSDKIKAKVLWLLGEMGLKYPIQVAPFIASIVQSLGSDHEKIRERAVGALGRIGRADSELIKPHLEKIINMAQDPIPDVRMNFIWASENIATNNPELFKNIMDTFRVLLDDKHIRVRMEAPEIFRVIGKRKPEYVVPYLPKLKEMSENDEDRVVRIHSTGAIKATKSKLKTLER